MIAPETCDALLEGNERLGQQARVDNEVYKHVARLDGYSDSDWAGSTDRMSQSSGVLFR